MRRAVKAKWTRHHRINLITCFALTLISSQLMIGCFNSSHKDMKQQAQEAIIDAGGVGLLGSEARVILDNYRVGLDWETVSNNGRDCPAIMRLYSILAPNGRYPWVVVGRQNLPAHVVIRFGTHRHYEYVWIFDPENVPIGSIEGVEHLGGAVYLSKVNK